MAWGCAAPGTSVPVARTASGPPAAATRADADLEPTDAHVDACADFARFACGPPGTPGDHARRPNDAMAWRRPAIERFMVEIADGQHADPRHGTPLLREFYLRCTDRAARDAGTAELRSELDQIARARALPALAHQLGHLRALGTRLLIDFTPERPEDQRTGVVSARVGLTAPRLPRRLYTPAHELVGAYRAHWQRLAHLSGDVSPAEADGAARIDRWLASAGVGPWGAAVSTRDPPPSSGPVARSALGRRRFPWAAYLSGLEPPVPGPFVTRTHDALARVDALVDLPLADLKSYVRIMLIERWSEFLDESFLDEELRFHEGTERGTQAAALALPAACTSLAARDLNPLLADAYLSELPDRGAEAIARQIFDRLRARLDRRIQRADWIADAARPLARRRLREVKLVFVGDLDVPDQLSAPLPAGSFLDLYRRTRQNDARNKLGLIGHPWTEEPLTPTLSPGEYFNGPNRVWISPEIVRPPYVRAYERAGDFNATSFGALGTVMGHEIAHAIPAALRRPPGPVTSATDTQPPTRVTGDTAGVTLSARLACLKRRFESVSPPDAATDARRTLGESWADRVGVDLALEAMDDEAITAGRARPLEDWQRDFFVAYAQTMCAFQSDTPAEIDSLRDPHAPARSRINSVVSDTPEFANAFSCAPNQPMSPRPCSAW